MGLNNITSRIFGLKIGAVGFDISKISEQIYLLLLIMYALKILFKHCIYGKRIAEKPVCSSLG